MEIKATTICAVKRNGVTAMAGDGQVTMGQSIVMKGNAKKVKRIYDDKVVVGFAGSVSDAFTLSEKFEEMLQKYSGNLMRSAVELAESWRKGTMMRNLEAMLIVADKDNLYLISGDGNVIEPEEGVCAIGSGGNYALSAARALIENTDMSAEEIVRKAMKIAADICVFTNHNIVVGEAKRAVAIALRNRYRRRMLPQEMREEITPKNIIMKGPTGVGKTEIARRLAKLVKAPFIKVEATKFTEVGYVGRDVESMIRDLVEVSLRMVREEKFAEVEPKAKEQAENKIVNAIYPIKKKANPELPDEKIKSDLLEDLRNGKLDKIPVEIEVEEAPKSLQLGPIGGGNDNNFGEIIEGLVGRRRKKRKMTVGSAFKIFVQEEANKLIDKDSITAEALKRAEEDGIIFIDEMDKVASSGKTGGGPDVSREGVQRDILPIVEGCTVSTKYGNIRTDFMLFIAAGAFHIAKVSDLIPELQGRFPVMVDLQSLTESDFEKILTEPDNAIIMQYAELLKVDKVELKFTQDAIKEMAHMARRLHTVMEALLEEISYNAEGEGELAETVIDREYVQKHLEKALRTMNLKKYIL